LTLDFSPAREAVIANKPSKICDAVKSYIEFCLLSGTYSLQLGLELLEVVALGDTAVPIGVLIVWHEMFAGFAVPMASMAAVWISRTVDTMVAGRREAVAS
jgi:hypothetical protein